MADLSLAVVGHSLIHDRQRLFWDYVDSLRGVEVQQIYPSNWGSLSREGGHAVRGGFDSYTFKAGAFDAVESFRPDVIRVDAEWWQYAALQVWRWAKRLDVPYVLFTWENIRCPWMGWHRRVLGDAALVVAGNREAEEIAREFNDNVVRLFQVGIRSDIFSPMCIVRQHDCLFVGRWTQEKGFRYINMLIKEGYDVVRARNYVYEDMPRLYSSCRVLLVPSLRTPNWMEQAPMAVVEAALCNTDVIAFDSGSMRGNFSETGAVYFVEEGDYPGLKRAIRLFLRSDDIPIYPTQRERMRSFDHVHVAEKFLSRLEEIL